MSKTRQSSDLILHNKATCEARAFKKLSEIQIPSIVSVESVAVGHTIVSIEIFHQRENYISIDNGYFNAYLIVKWCI